MKKPLKKSGSAKVKIGVGVLTAAALAGAAAYWLTGKEGKERREKLKTWAQDAQKDVMVKLARAKGMSQDEYDRLVDIAVERYGALADASGPELKKTAAMLKTEWKHIQTKAKKLAK